MEKILGAVYDIYISGNVDARGHVRIPSILG